MYYISQPGATDLTKIAGFKRDKRRHALAALANLARFIGCYAEYSKAVKSAGLKWETAKTADLLRARLKKARANGSVLVWVQTVVDRLPELALFMELLVKSGVRVVEAVECYNKIIELARVGKLGEYYDSEAEMLLHLNYPEAFIRGSKNVYVSIVHPDIIQRIAVTEPLTLDGITHKIKRHVTPNMRLNEIREYWATVQTKFLTVAEIDFLTGRVAGVYMKHYFNPGVITDLRERVYKGLEALIVPTFLTVKD